MGLLSANEKTAIQGEPVYRHIWKILVPQAAGSGTVQSNTIHDDVDGPICVTDPGEYAVEGVNQSLGVPGNMTSGMYRFEVANGDGLFYTATSGNWFYNTTGSYQADPIECDLQHIIYVKIADGSWSLLEMLSYEGKIQDIEYNDNTRTAVIEAKAIAAVAMDYEWVNDDGIETETSMNF